MNGIGQITSGVKSAKWFTLDAELVTKPLDFQWRAMRLTDRGWHLEGTGKRGLVVVADLLYNLRLPDSRLKVEAHGKLGGRTVSYFVEFKPDAALLSVLAEVLNYTAGPLLREPCVMYELENVSQVENRLF